MKQLRLIKGTPHTFKNLVYLKNSANKHRDNHPLSGQGNIQRYKLNNGKVFYDSKDVNIHDDKRGFSEQTIAELTNFSNTSVLAHKNTIMSFMETKPPYILNINTLHTELLTSINMGVHWAYHNDELFAFNLDDRLLQILFVKNPFSISIYDSIKLPNNYYIHDMTIINDTIFFPLFPYSIDMFNMNLGVSSIADSVKFTYPSHASILTYNIKTKQSNIIKLPTITSPIFHIKSVQNVLYFFACQENFQLSSITSKSDYISSCHKIEINTLNSKPIISLTQFPDLGDMPSTDNNCLVYVNNEDGIGKTISILPNGTIVQRAYPNGIVEEPQALDNNTTLQIVHIKKSTLLYILETDTLLVKGIYSGDETPIGFHGSYYFIC